MQVAIAFCAVISMIIIGASLYVYIKNEVKENILSHDTLIWKLKRQKRRSKK